MTRDKTPRRLFKNPDRVSSYRLDKSPARRMKQMAREHEDVLQNIEFALVTAHRNAPEFDDREARAALLACRHGTDVDEPRVAAALDSLRSVRELREDVADDVWFECLQVVEDSIRRHSGFRPGETTYLAFAGRFIV